MSSVTLALILGFLVLLALSAAFSGGETALFSLDRFQIRRFENASSKRQRLVARMVSRPEQLLAVILLGDTVVNIAGSSVLLAITRRLEGRLFGVDPVAVAVILGSGIILLFGEVLPKAIAVHWRERLAPVVVVPLSGFLAMTLPLVRVLERCARGILRLAGVKPPEVGGRLARGELRILFEDIRAREEFSEDEGTIASNVFTFFDTRAYEIMTPRVDLAGIPFETDPKKLRASVIAARHSRLPVYHESLDRIVGFINSKECLLDPEAPLPTLLREVHFVPERARLGRLLSAVQARRANIVIVVNEYGGTAGLITKEDLVEELVGEIFDEQERDVAPELEPVDAASWRVAGLLHLDDLAEATETPRPEGPAETVAGLVAHLLGRPPRPGDEASDGTFVYRVLQVRRHRAQRVLVTLLPKEKEEGTA